MYRALGKRSVAMRKSSGSCYGCSYRVGSSASNSSNTTTNTGTITTTTISNTTPNATPNTTSNITPNTTNITHFSFNDLLGSSLDNPALNLSHNAIRAIINLLAKAHALNSQVDEQAVIKLSGGALIELTRLGNIMMTHSPASRSLAVDLYKTAHRHGEFNASYIWAEMLLKGQQVSRDVNKAKEILTHLAKQGHPNAQCLLAGYYQHEEKNEKLAIELYELAVHNDNSIALLELAMIHLSQNSSHYNLNKAIEYLQLASSKGLPKAMLTLAQLYQVGEYVQQSDQQSFIYALQAAELGDKNAQQMIGNKYMQGHGVQKDLKKAELWWELSAKKGNLISMFNLASLYHDLGRDNEAKELLIPLSQNPGQVGDLAKDLLPHTTQDHPNTNNNNNEAQQKKTCIVM